jgi:hypothetical protein
MKEITHMSSSMFESALTSTVSSVMIVGILLMLVALPKLRARTRKLRQRNIARSKLNSYEGY